jgi:hypothetical protein
LVNLLKNILDAPTGTNKSWSQDSVDSIGKDVRSFMSITESGAAINSLNDAILAMAKIAKALKDADYTKMKPENAAKCIQQLAKMVDETTRLMEFAKGNPDSRPDIGVQDFLKYLSNEQFVQLNEWISLGKAKLVNGPGNTYQS